MRDRNHTEREQGQREESAAGDAGGPRTASPRRPWEKPVLLEFGNVREMTRGGGTRASEPRTGLRRFTGPQ